MSTSEIIELFWMGLFLISFLIFFLGLLWLCVNITDLSSRRRALQSAIDEMDTSLSIFFDEHESSNSPPAYRSYRGTISSSVSGAPLRALLSGRPCLGYSIEFGFPENEDLTLFVDHSECEHMSFLIDGRTRISLADPFFRFSPASIANRLEFRPDQISPSFREKHVALFAPTREDMKNWTRGRFYEWIIPPGAQCELAGRAEPEPLHYRSAGDVRLHDTRILVGPRNDDRAAAERLRRARATAQQEIQRIRRKYWYVAMIGSLPILYSLWLFWFLFHELIITYPH